MFPALSHTHLLNPLSTHPRLPFFLPKVQLPGRHAPMAGGTFLYVQNNASLFCMEPAPALNSSGQPISNVEICPTWAGGDGKTQFPRGQLNNGWIMLNFTAGDASSIKVDLTPLNGTQPTAVRYAWGVTDCCNYTDPTLFVTHGWYVVTRGVGAEDVPAWAWAPVGKGDPRRRKERACQAAAGTADASPSASVSHGSIAECPIYSTSGLPANPFQAKIEQGRCACVAPQVCDES